MTTQRYQNQDSSLARRVDKHLQPIEEEDSDNEWGAQRKTFAMSGRRANASHLKIDAFFSPMSDHFPTPRGNHYLAAPVLPSSPSTASLDEDSSSIASNPWSYNRASTTTVNTEFEDLYDVSDEEKDVPLRSLQRTSSVRANQNRGTSRQPTPLVIPVQGSGLNIMESKSAVKELKKLQSPVPLTPSFQLTMSPAQQSFMDIQQTLEVLGSSAPPSLDGSLSSEQLAQMSAPPTPVAGNDDITTEEAWAGVQLQPGAMATLHSLSNSSLEDLHGQPTRAIDVSLTQAPPVVEMMQQPQRQQQPLVPLRLVTAFSVAASRNAGFSSAMNKHSSVDLAKLDIPSPGGFFSGLSPRTRTTWSAPRKVVEDAVPPTSTTAEHFYRCPWNTDTAAPPVPKRSDPVESFYRDSAVSSEPVERVIEIPADHMISDDLLTARPILQQTNSDETVKAPASPQNQVVPTEIVLDLNANYAREQQQQALSNLDRTGFWLMAQRAYFSGVMPGTEEADDKALNTIVEHIEEEVEEESKSNKVKVDASKKIVRFSNVIATSTPKRLPSKLIRQESAFYRGFQDYIVRVQRQDAFVHSLSRFEALQTQRTCLRVTHRNQLLGKYQLSVLPQSAKKRLSANVARGDDNLIDDPEKLRKEKEMEAMIQATMATWHVAATKFLNGGKLIMAPVTKRLARLSHSVLRQNGVARDRARILDLGGQATCDWAWHVALQYPNTKIYTVTTKAVRQLSNANIRGPSNHRQVAVERLTRLPFDDNQFDLVSARELHSLLKFTGENGEDEWETCLRECMRVLKPGGYLEFSLLDSDIMNAGPLGLAKSVEFGFALKTLGYDPSPTKMWLGRLDRAGFQDAHRAWMCMPVGPKRSLHKFAAPSMDTTVGTQGKVCQMDAITMGSTDDVASVCAVAGGWNWERWLLRCEMEKVAGKLRLQDTVTAGSAMTEAGKCLEDVAGVMEEGRNCRAGFRMLNGYARKPRAGSQTI